LVLTVAFADLEGARAPPYLVADQLAGRTEDAQRRDWEVLAGLD
jgi:hypothetical protein